MWSDPEIEHISPENQTVNTDRAVGRPGKHIRITAAVFN
jgi:hypothetical protein